MYTTGENMEIVGERLGLIIVWIGGLVILAILFWIFFRMSNPEKKKKNPSLKSDPEKNSKDLLKDQFSRGEISKEEYKDRINKMGPSSRK